MDARHSAPVRGRMAASRARRLIAAGRYAPAERAADRVIAWAGDDPAGTRWLVGFLSEFAVSMRQAGQPDRALPYLRRGVERQRTLGAPSDRARLATLLAQLSVALLGLGRSAESAAAAADEAAAVARSLVASEPGELVLISAGYALQRAGLASRALGRRADAVVATTEAVAVFRRLAAGDPTLYGPAVAEAERQLAALAGEPQSPGAAGGRPGSAEVVSAGTTGTADPTGAASRPDPAGATGAANATSPASSGGAPRRKRQAARPVRAVRVTRFVPAAAPPPAVPAKGVSPLPFFKGHAYRFTENLVYAGIAALATAVAALAAARTDGWLRLLSAVVLLSGYLAVMQTIGAQLIRWRREGRFTGFATTWNLIWLAIIVGCWLPILFRAVGIAPIDFAILITGSLVGQLACYGLWSLSFARWYLPARFPRWWFRITVQIGAVTGAMLALAIVHAMADTLDP